MVKSLTIDRRLYEINKMHGLGNEFILFADPQGANKGLY